MLSAVIKMTGGDRNTVLSTLMPEIDRKLSRTDADVRIEGDTLLISVNATDVSAMRAALNSYLGWIKITEDIEKITGDKNE